MSTFTCLPNGTYGATDGTLIVLSLVFWIVGLSGLLQELATRLPKYSAALGVVMVYGAVGGVAFGLRGYYEQLYGLSRTQSLDIVGPEPVSNLLFYWPGPLFPLSLVLIGAGIAYTRIAPLWTVALAALAGVLFPLSRIPRSPEIAHLADAVMLVVFGYLGWLLLGARCRSRQPA